MMLRGYRREDAGLLSGTWLPGELLGLPIAGRPALAVNSVMEPPKDHTAEVCVVSGLAFVRFSELDWVHRRARVEIGLQEGAAEEAGLLLKSAVMHGFRVLNLRRIYGWVTPATAVPSELLVENGFRCEATIPENVWFAGEPASRELWGAVRDE